MPFLIEKKKEKKKGKAIILIMNTDKYTIEHVKWLYSCSGLNKESYPNREIFSSIRTVGLFE